MARYVESAVLQLLDQTSGVANKIRMSLAKLRAEADLLNNKRINLAINDADFKRAAMNAAFLRNMVRSVSNQKIKIGIDDGGTSRVRGNLTSIKSAMNAIDAKPVKIKIDASQVTAASSQVSGLRSNIANVKGGGRVPPGKTGPAAPVGPTTPAITTTRPSVVDQGLRWTASNAWDEAKLQDQSRSWMKRQGLNDQVIALFEKTAKEQSSKNPVITQGKLLELQTDMAASVKPGQEGMVSAAMPTFAKAVLSASMLPGANRKNIIEGLEKLSKSANILGVMTDDKGQFDAAGFDKLVTTFTQVQGVTGRSLPIDQVLQAIKQARATGRTLDDNGLRTLLLTAADYGGQRAGTQFTSVIQSLTGAGGISVQAMRNQVSAGLVTGREEGTGRNKRFVRTGTIDEELLRENPFEWTKKHLFPKVKEAGIDPNDPKQAAAATKFLAPMFPKQVAQGQLQEFLTQMMEINNQIEKSKLIVSDEAGLREIANKSLSIKVDELANEVSSAGANLITSLNGITFPLLDFGKNMATKAKEFFGDDKVSPETKALAATGGIVAALGTLQTIAQMGKNWVFNQPLMQGTAARGAASLVPRLANPVTGLATVIPMMLSEEGRKWGEQNAKKTELTKLVEALADVRGQFSEAIRDSMKDQTPASQMRVSSLEAQIEVLTSAIEKEKAKIKEEGDKVSQIPAIGKPEFTPTIGLPKPGAPTVPSADSLGFPAIGEQMKASSSEVKSAIDSMPATLSGFTSRLPAAFAEGGDAMSQKLQSGAASAGSVFGDAALAKIQSATVNINVNSSGGPNTGRSTQASQ